jgi:PhnB protein
MQSQIYLFFDGRTEEALEFYKKTLGIEVEMLMRFKDNPDFEDNPKANDPGCAPNGNPNAIMHSSFKLGGQRMMASDGNAMGKPEFKGFALSLAVNSEAEADRLFTALSEGGKVQMPLGKTFFAPKFGMVADKFGVGWMVLVAQQ